jgi:5-oxoprolinase (ATP-hydrolysing) subunit A
MGQIDLNSDLGEGFGPWKMGDDAAMLAVVTSANIACGGHASDPETMFATLVSAREQGVVIGAHPGFADREGFGRRIVAMSCPEVERMVAAQIGTLMGIAALAGAKVRYVKAHGALANLAADDDGVARAVVRAVAAVSRDLAFLAISGTCQEVAARAQGLDTYAEVFGDRAYLPNGRLVPRGQDGAMILDHGAAAERLVRFVATGMMPVVGGAPIALRAQSVCVHGDSPGAVAMARHLGQALGLAGVGVAAFLAPP